MALSFERDLPPRSFRGNCPDYTQTRVSLAAAALDGSLRLWGVRP